MNKRRKKQKNYSLLNDTDLINQFVNFKDDYQQRNISTKPDCLN